jgi:6-phosphofructokinase 1
MTDLDESENVAAAAVQAAMSGKSGIMMTIERLGNSPYEVRYGNVDVKLCANGVQRFPEKWINADGNGILAQAKEYFLPLIQGQVNVQYEDGIPLHFYIHDSDFNA